MKRNNKGFTLIELLAAVVILAILIAVSIPIITGLLDRSRAKMYVSDAKKLAALVEYKINANSSVIEKPDDGDCILVSMLYLQSSDFDSPPGEGEYLKESSYVVVKNNGGKLEYSPTIVERVKNGGYKGVVLVRKEKLSNNDAIDNVVSFKDNDILNVETDVNRGYINEKLGKDYVTVDNNITAIYNKPELIDDSSSTISPEIPRIVYASMISTSNKYFNSLDATLQIKVDDKDTPRKDLSIYLDIGNGYRETGSSLPYGDEEVFSYDVNFGDYGKTYDGDSIKVYVVVKDPQGNTDKKTITYKIHKNEGPTIDDSSSLTRRDIDIYHDKKLNMLKAKFKLIVYDDLDENSDLQVCVKESSTNELYESCDDYHPYYEKFDNNGIWEYQFNNCANGRCVRDGSTHYLTVFVKDTLGGVSSRKFVYKFSKNVNPVLKSFKLRPQNEPYASTGSKTVYVSVVATDDVDDTALGNNLYIELTTDGIGSSTCSYSPIYSPNAECALYLNHKYDGATVPIYIRVFDSEGGYSNMMKTDYTLYINQDPVINSFSIESSGDPCIDKELCNTYTGGNKTVNVYLDAEDDVDYTGLGMEVCFSLDSHTCDANSRYYPYNKYAGNRGTYTIPSDYDGSTKTIYLYLRDSEGAIVSAHSLPYTLYVNSGPKLDFVTFTTKPNTKPTSNSLNTIFNISARDDVDNASNIRFQIKENNVLVKEAMLSDYMGKDNEYRLSGIHDGVTRNIQVTVIDSEGLTDSKTLTYDVYQGSAPVIDSFRIFSDGEPCDNEDYCSGLSGNYKIKYTVQASDDIDDDEVLGICVSEDSNTCTNEYRPYSDYIEDDKPKKMAYTFNVSNPDRPYDGTKKTLYLYVKDTDNNITKSSLEYTLYANKAPEITEDPVIVSNADKTSVHIPNVTYTIDAVDDIDDELYIKYCYEKTGNDYCTQYEKLNGPKILDNSFFNVVRPSGESFSIYSVIKDSYGVETQSSKLTYKLYTDMAPSIYQATIVSGTMFYSNGSSEVESLDGIEDPSDYGEYTRLNIRFTVDDPYDKYRVCVSNTNSCSNYLRKEYPGNECNGSSCTNRAAYEIQYVKDGFINEGDNFTLYFFVRDSYGVVTSTVLYDEVYHECDDTIGKYEYELVPESTPITTSSCQGKCYYYNSNEGTTNSLFGTYKTTIRYKDRLNNGISCNEDNPVIENRVESCDFIECFNVNNNYQRNAIGTKYIRDDSNWTILINNTNYVCTGHYVLYLSSYKAYDEKITLTPTDTKICAEAVSAGEYNYNSQDANPWIRVDD